MGNLLDSEMTSFQIDRKTQLISTIVLPLSSLAMYVIYSRRLAEPKARQSWLWTARCQEYGL